MEKAYASAFSEYGEDVQGENYWAKREAQVNSLVGAESCRPSAKLVRAGAAKERSVFASQFTDVHRTPELRTDVFGLIEEDNVEVTDEFFDSLIQKQRVDILTAIDEDESITLRKAAPQTSDVPLPDGPLSQFLDDNVELGGVPDFDKALESLSPEQIATAQRILERKLNPNTLAILKRRRREPVTPTETTQDTEVDSRKTQTDSDSLDLKVRKLHSQIAPAFGMASETSSDVNVAVPTPPNIAFELGPGDLRKLDWMSGCSEETEELRAKAFSGMMAELRFDFEGDLISPWTVNPTKTEIFLDDEANISGLRNHGLLPHLPGYSLPELLIFMASSFRPQRLIGLRVIQRVLAKRFIRHSSRSRIPAKTQRSKGLEKFNLPRPTSGFGFGRRRFDDYLFGSLFLHEKLLVCACSDDRTVVAEALAALVAAFSSRAEGPLKALDNAFFGLSPFRAPSGLFWSTHHADYLTSRRSLLRQEDLERVLGRGEETDFSLKLKDLILNGPDGRSDTHPSQLLSNNAPLGDAEIYYRRTDPLLSLLLWAPPTASSNIINVPIVLRLFAREMATGEPDISQSAMTMLEAYALHSTMAAELVRRAIMERDADGDPWLSLAIGRLTIIFDVPTSGSETTEETREVLRDRWRFNAPRLLALIRCIASALKVPPTVLLDDLTESDRPDLPVASLCWYFVGEWLGSLGGTKVPVRGLLAQPPSLALEEAIEWIPHLARDSMDSACPAALLALNGNLHKYVEVILRNAHEIIDPGVAANFCRVWGLLVHLSIQSMSKNGVDALTFASFVGRHTPRAQNFLLSLILVSQDIPCGAETVLAATLEHTTFMVELSELLLSRGKSSASIEGFVTSLVRVNRVASDSLWRPFGHRDDENTTSLIDSKVYHVSHDTATLLRRNIDNLDLDNLFEEGDANGIFSDWIIAPGDRQVVAGGVSKLAPGCSGIAALIILGSALGAFYACRFAEDTDWSPSAQFLELYTSTLVSFGERLARRLNPNQPLLRDSTLRTLSSTDGARFTLTCPWTAPVCQALLAFMRLKAAVHSCSPTSGFSRGSALTALLGTATCTAHINDIATICRKDNLTVLNTEALWIFLTRLFTGEVEADTEEPCQGLSLLPHTVATNPLHCILSVELWLWQHALEVQAGLSSHNSSFSGSLPIRMLQVLLDPSSSLIPPSQSSLLIGLLEHLSRPLRFASAEAIKQSEALANEITSYLVGDVDNGDAHELLRLFDLGKEYTIEEAVCFVRDRGGTTFGLRSPNPTVSKLISALTPNELARVKDLLLPGILNVLKSDMNLMTARCAWVWLLRMDERLNGPLTRSIWTEADFMPLAARVLLANEHFAGLPIILFRSIPLDLHLLDCDSFLRAHQGKVPSVVSLPQLLAFEVAAVEY